MNVQHKYGVPHGHQLTAGDINVGNVKKLVPPAMLNFLAWALGFSDDTEETQYRDCGDNNF